MAQNFFDGLKKKFQALSKQQKYLGLAALVLIVLLFVLIFAGPKPFSILGFGNQSIQITNVYSDRQKTPTSDSENSDMTETANQTAADMGQQDTPVAGNQETAENQPAQTTANASGTNIAPISGSSTQQPGVQPSATQRSQQNPTATPRASNPYPLQPTNTRVAPTGQPTATVSVPTETYDGPEARWLGEWDIQFELANGTYQTGNISFELTGNDGQYRASGTLGGAAFSIEGRFVYDGFVAFGSWSTSAGSGQIEITSTDGLVFGGNHETDLAFCGARQGQKMPTACYIPPSQ